MDYKQTSIVNKMNNKKYEYENGVLINKLGIKDQEKLKEFERFQTNLAERTLPSFSLDFEGLKKIHKHLFENVYEWAGEPRESILQKEDTFFVPHTRLNRAINELFSELERKNHLKGLSQQEFALQVSDVFGKLNNIHPFREGNGRTQRIFISELALQAGHQLDFSEITQERMIQASIEFNQGNPKKMQEMFTECLDKQMVANLRIFNNVLRKEKGVNNWNALFVSHSHSGNNYQGIFVGNDSTTFVMQLTKPSDTLSKYSIIISKYDDMKYLNIQPSKIGDKITLNIPHQQEKIIQQLKDQLTANNIKKDYPTISDNDAKTIELFANYQLSQHQNPKAQQAILEKIQSQLPDIESGKIVLPDLPTQDKGKGR